MNASPLSQSRMPTGPKPRSGLRLQIILGLAILLCFGLAYLALMQQQQVETVVVTTRAIPYGQVIPPDALKTIEVPRDRPIEIKGLGAPQAVIGRWASHDLGANDILEAADLLQQPPTCPVYPNGRCLASDMVALPFPVKALGPLSDRDVVNLGYSDPAGDPRRCAEQGGALVGDQAPDADSAAAGLAPEPYACRLLTQVPVLYIDQTGGIAYLQMTPYQAHAVRALDAAQLPLWGERYGSASAPLVALQKLSPAEVALDPLIATTATLRLAPGVYVLPQTIGGLPSTEEQTASGAK
jgi:hypothetical protein